MAKSISALQTNQSLIKLRFNMMNNKRKTKGNMLQTTTKLRELDLSSDDIDDEGTAILEATLRRNSTVKKLCMVNIQSIHRLGCNRSYKNFQTIFYIRRTQYK